MFIEDAPPRHEILRSVVITIDRVEAVRVFVADPPPDGNGIATETVFRLTRTSSSVDVLPLKAGRRERIATGEVPPGEYYVRLYLSGGQVVTTTRTYSTQNGLMTLGGGTDAGSGVRRFVVKTEFQEVVPVFKDQTNGILVDMDLEESLTAQGDPEQPTRIDMVPVLRLREGFAGGFRGVVRHDNRTPDDPSDDVPLPNAPVLLLQSGGVDDSLITAATRTDAAGRYELRGVVPGSAVFQLIFSDPSRPRRFTDHLAPRMEPTNGQFITYDALLKTPTGRLDVFLEDAPPRHEILRSVVVDIDRVEAVNVFVAEPPPDGNGFAIETVFPLTRTTDSVDVLPLRAGRRELIATREVPHGEYYLRLYLTGGQVVTTTRTYSTDNGLMTFGGGTDAGAGVRRFIVKTAHDEPVGVRRDATNGMILDMDLEESLTVEGDPEQPTRIAMVPTLRLREGFDGGFRGVVRTDNGTPADPSDDLPLANVGVLMIQEGGVNGDSPITALTRTDAQGVYVLRGVVPGSVVFQLIFSVPPPANADYVDHLAPRMEPAAGQFITYDVLFQKGAN